MKQISEHIKPILALIIIVLSFTYFFAILIIQEQVNDQVLIAIVSMVTGAIGYYYGSTTGSSRKDEVINDLAKTNSSSGVTSSGDVNIDTKKDGKG